jgi:hypothetical protein
MAAGCWCSYGLRVTSYELRVTSYELRVRRVASSARGCSSVDLAATVPLRNYAHCPRFDCILSSRPGKSGFAINQVEKTHVLWDKSPRPVVVALRADVAVL